MGGKRHDVHREQKPQYLIQLLAQLLGTDTRVRIHKDEVQTYVLATALR